MATESPVRDLPVGAVVSLACEAAELGDALAFCTGLLVVQSLVLGAGFSGEITREKPACESLTCRSWRCGWDVLVSAMNAERNAKTRKENSELDDRESDMAVCDGMDGEWTVRCDERRPLCCGMRALHCGATRSTAVQSKTAAHNGEIL